MKRIPFVILLGSLLATTTAVATTYMRVEPDGTKTYSDRPLAGGHPIELESAQTYTAAPAPASAPSGTPSEQALLGQVDDFRYDSCELTPKQDATFTNPENVAILVRMKPLLRPVDTVDLRIDGTSVGGPNTTSFTMQPVYRGAHTVSVVVKNRGGRTLCSASVTFHVFRPNLNSPARH